MADDRAWHRFVLPLDLHLLRSSGCRRGATRSRPPTLPGERLPPSVRVAAPVTLERAPAVAAGRPRQARMADLKFAEKRHKFEHNGERRAPPSSQPLVPLL